MDPALVKKYKDNVADLVAKIWNPPSEGFEEFQDNQEIIDFEKILGHEISLITHYRVNGHLPLTPLLTRGYFESRKLKVTEHDVVLASFPKSGSTWLQEIVFLVNSDCDFAAAKSENVDERCPLVEFPECTFATLQQRPPPRVMKTHLPYSMLPGGDEKDYKIVYITRNPKDVVVSLYHFMKGSPPFCFNGALSDVVDLFINDSSICAPYHSHALGYWDRVQNGNILFLKYEDLIKDAAAQIRRISEFFGKNFTNDQIQGIVSATCFQEMAAQGTKHHGQWADMKFFDPKAGKFMRKGKVGDWKLHFDEATNKRFDEYIEKYLGNTGLEFDYV